MSIILGLYGIGEMTLLGDVRQQGCMVVPQVDGNTIASDA